MGFWSKLTSGLDFWDKQENQGQREQFAREDEERRRRREQTTAPTPVMRPGPYAAPQTITPTQPTPPPNITNLSSAMGQSPLLQPNTLQVNAPQKSVRDVVKKPQQSFFNKVRDITDANTDADKYRRTVKEAGEINQRLLSKGVDREKALNTSVDIASELAKTPYRTGVDSVRDFGTGSARAAASLVVAPQRIVLGAAEGVGSLPKLGLNVVDWADRQTPWSERTDKWDLTRNVDQWTKTALEKTVDPLSRATDETAEAIAGEGNTAAYRNAQIGGEVIAGVASFGATAAVSATSKASKVAKLLDLANDARKAGDLAEFTRLSDLASKASKFSSRAGKLADQFGGNSKALQEAGDLINAPLKFIKGNSKKAVGRLTGADATEEALDTLSTGIISDSIPTKPGIPMEEIADGVKVPGVEPPAQIPELPVNQIDTPPVRPDIPIQPEIPARIPEPIQPSPSFGELIQPEVLSKAPINQPIDNVPVRIDTPNQPTRQMLESAPDSTIRQVQPEESAIKARSAQEALDENALIKTEKPANVAQAEALANDAPPIVPVDNSGNVIRNVDEAPDVPAQSTKAIDPGEGAEVSVDARVKPIKRTPQSELPETSTTGLAKTDETGKSKGKYSKGQEYEKTSIKAVTEQGEKSASQTSYSKFFDEVDKRGTFTSEDRSTAVALQKRFDTGSPEHKALGDIVNKANTDSAQAMATIERTIRKTADSRQLSDRFSNKLYSKLDEGQVVSKPDFDKVRAKNDDFVKARDDVNRALETFNTDPSKANMEAYIKSKGAIGDADKAAKFTEYQVASTIAKKSKNPEAAKFIKKLESDAGVYTMDWIDSSLLSSTRVMLNNYINTGTVALEERAFGKVGSKIANLITGETVGGGSRTGYKLGSKIGTQTTKSDAILRQQANGNALVKGIKNFTTTGNTLGERNIMGTAYSGVYDHYYQSLKKSGVTGDELKNRAMVSTLDDAEGVLERYMNPALGANAMSGTTSFYKGKIESQMADSLSKVLGDSNLAKTAAKSIVRVTVGFPTVVVRSAKEGAKRTTLGTPSFIRAGFALRSGNKAAAADLIKAGVKEAGSGAVMVGLGGALGSAGLITGAYPTDTEEQARWKREGISDNSIKIGKDYYSLPAALGAFALPFMIGANAGSNLTEDKQLTDGFFKDTLQTVINSTPVDSFSNTLKIFQDAERGKDVSAKIAALAASGTKSLAPLSGLMNQISKMIDPTANDTKRESAVQEFMAKVQDGIPGLANSLPAREVDGVEIKNPNPIAKMFGATTTEQSAGVEKTNRVAGEVSDNVKTLKDYNAFSDGVRNLLDDDKKALLDKARDGKKLSEDELKDLKSDMVKGVTDTGNNQFLEKEDYDNNLAVLKVKRETMASDPTTTKESLDKYDTQIKRGEIYQKNKTKYTLIKDYEDVSLEEWRKMGDPDSEEYNVEKYQELWALDEELAKEGASRDDEKTKQKYYSKESKRGGGKGGSGGKAGARSSDSRQISSTLGSKGVKDNKYQAIDRPKSYIPDLKLSNKARTNLKKGISIKKGVSYNV